jgi:N-acyl-D-aspartate/D-glutamate deacylase
MDLWLCDGLVVDGTGADPFVGDVGIHRDVISEVRTVDECDRNPSGASVDCSGLVIVPGFIDIHTHSDLSFLLNRNADSKVMQGVTTEVTGNCGFSPFPVGSDAQRRRLLEQFMEGIGVSRIDVDWTCLDDYVIRLEEFGLPLNVAPLVGHGSLRIAAMGMEDSEVTDEKLSVMDTLLRESLDQGVFGMSSGLSYVPSRFASTAEVHHLCHTLSEFDAIYSTHPRVAPGFGSFTEAIEVARRTGTRVQFSHVALNDPTMWGRAANVIELFRSAAEGGVDIRYDVYPYDASSSSLTQYLPSWIQENGQSGLRAQLADRATFRRARDELAAGLFGTIPWQWDRVVLARVGAGDEELEGRTVMDAADHRGMSPEELCLRLCGRHGNEVQVVLFYRIEEDVMTFLSDPLSIVGSDGSAMSVDAAGVPHPRNFGAHARLFERYVRDRPVLTLTDAVHKSSLAAARQLGIIDRGSILPGMKADLAALDLMVFKETATWTRPCQFASGVRHVWINGQAAVADGARTPAMPGTVLRRR